ncbi:MAG: hypothetical protein AAGA56_10825 [Myxococcota bacterium]
MCIEYLGRARALESGKRIGRTPASGAGRRVRDVVRLESGASFELLPGSCLTIGSGPLCEVRIEGLPKVAGTVIFLGQRPAQLAVVAHSACEGAGDVEFDGVESPVHMLGPGDAFALAGHRFLCRLPHATARVAVAAPPAPLRAMV